MSLPLMFAPCHLYKSVYRVLMRGGGGGWMWNWWDTAGQNGRLW